MRGLREIIACVLAPSALFGQVASVAFDESLAVYGPGIFPAVTRLQICEPYRVLVAYLNGTDMLFVDEMVRSRNQSTYEVSNGISVREFNYYEASAEIEKVSCRIDGEGSLEVFGQAHSFHADRDYTFDMKFSGALDSYSYSESEIE